MDSILRLLLAAAGILAGFVDSIAGGGGLITVPIFSLVLGPGATAIGTNKIVAVCASLVALLVYLRGGHVSLRGNLIFALIVGASASLGAFLAPFLPGSVHRWILIVIGPVILWIVYRKDLWIQKEIELDQHEGRPLVRPSGLRPAGLMNRQSLLLWGAGFVCGFYDGIAGPGGGTLMFLSLLLVARIPLLNAMATAKVANLASAFVSLCSYTATGHVRWETGWPMALGISFGAFAGASLATRRAAPLARAALLIVASILLFRLIFS